MYDATGLTRYGTGHGERLEAFAALSLPIPRESGGGLLGDVPITLASKHRLTRQWPAESGHKSHRLRKAIAPKTPPAKSANEGQQG
jgi:hypothetical protein